MPAFRAALALHPGEQCTARGIAKADRSNAAQRTLRVTPPHPSFAPVLPDERRQLRAVPPATPRPTMPARGVRDSPPLLYGLIRLKLMCLLVSRISMVRAAALVPGFLGAWVIAWLTASVFAFRVVLLLAPIAHSGRATTANH